MLGRLRPLERLLRLPASVFFSPYLEVDLPPVWLDTATAASAPVRPIRSKDPRKRTDPNIPAACPWGVCSHRLSPRRRPRVVSLFIMWSSLKNAYLICICYPFALSLGFAPTAPYNAPGRLCDGSSHETLSKVLSPLKCLSWLKIPMDEEQGGQAVCRGGGIQGKRVSGEKMNASVVMCRRRG